MSTSLARTTFTRRHFLKQFSTTGALVLLSPGLSALPIGSPASSSLRTGVILPRFESYPQIWSSFLRGMSLLMSQDERKARLTAVETQKKSGFSVALAEQLLADDVDAIVSMVRPALTRELHALLTEAGVPLLVSHAGANRLGKAASHIFYNTLGYWQASYRAGTWAAESLGQRAVVVSSFYESGYDALYAFEQGLVAQGGEVLDTYVTHVPTREIGMATLVRRIDAHDPDFVYGHLSGRAAVDFITAYSSSPFTRTRPLIGSSFLLEQTGQRSVRGALRDSHTVSSWSPSLTTPQNERFVAAFSARYGQTPDSFAVLGVDTAGLLAAALQAAGEPGPGFVEALRRAQFEGPRGKLQMGAEEQSVTAPLYLRRTVGEGGTFRHEVTASMAPVSNQITRQQALRTGWLNPYLSV